MSICFLASLVANPGAIDKVSSSVKHWSPRRHIQMIPFHFQPPKRLSGNWCYKFIIKILGGELVKRDSSQSSGTPARAFGTTKTLPGLPLRESCGRRGQSDTFRFKAAAFPHNCFGTLGRDHVFNQIVRLVQVNPTHCNSVVFGHKISIPLHPDYLYQGGGERYSLMYMVLSI